MSVSNKVKGLMAMCGKRQNDLAACFGMTKQSMSNKIAKNSWSASDLIKVANFCDSRLAFVMRDGQMIIIDNDSEKNSNVAD